MPELKACLACGSPASYPVYHPENQPLAALSLPRSAKAAQSAPRLPMDFVACAYCGHIWNREFSYKNVPYQEDSNLMFNHGSGWQAYIQDMIDRMHAKYDFSGKTVIEIGCGDGHFLVSLGKKIQELKLVGYEPGIDPLSMQGSSIEVFNDYFLPERDLEKHKPDLLICRHVLEHLDAPREFVQTIAYWCNMVGVFPYFLAEVPRINNAVEQTRINDYLYEHVSNFTDASLRAMFDLAGFEVLEFEKAYRDEVLVALVRPKKLEQLTGIKTQISHYHDAIASQGESVRASLKAWRDAGKIIAFWGGTGKGASFLNGFGVDAASYPLVIDSDIHKIGRFVPGTGQEIRPPEYLNANKPDIIVITTQWRAADIADEIARRGIDCRELYIVRNQKLEKLS